MLLFQEPTDQPTDQPTDRPTDRPIHHQLLLLPLPHVTCIQLPAITINQQGTTHCSRGQEEIKQEKLPFTHSPDTEESGARQAATLECSKRRLANRNRVKHRCPDQPLRGSKTTSRNTKIRAYVSSPSHLVVVLRDTAAAAKS